MLVFLTENDLKNLPYANFLEVNSSYYKPDQKLTHGFGFDLEGNYCSQSQVLLSFSGRCKVILTLKQDLLLELLQHLLLKYASYAS